MAIDFPTDFYPLLQDAGDADHFSSVTRDLMDDGTPRLRVTSTLGPWLEFPLSFAPLNLARAQLLLAYMRANAATHFNIMYAGSLWQGYLWSEPTSTRSDNQWWVGVKFYGGKIA